MVEPGWYPDPDGADCARYWDGTEWTTALRRHPSEPARRPVSSGRFHDQRKVMIGLGVALAVVLATLALGLVALFRPAGNWGNAAPEGEAGAALSGKSDDWLASVCRPGKYMDGGTNMPGSLTSGLCLSAADGTSISVGSFASDFAAKNAAAMHTNQGGRYAIGVAEGGTVWLFVSSWQEKGQSLSPLTRFGFTIH